MEDDAIKTFEVEFTNNCNSRCIFCPRDAHKREKGYMSWDTVKAIAAWLNKFKIKKIIISGFGEPLLHPDALGFIGKFNKEAPEAKIELITNGSMLAAKKLGELEGLNIEKMIISFSGYDKRSYERIMQRLVFEETVSNLKCLVSEHEALLKITKIRPVIHKGFKEEDYRKMVIFLKSIGFKDGNLDEVYDCSNRGGFLADKNVLPAETSGEKIDPNRIFCMMYIDTLQIAWNGEILLCCNDINNEAKIGNIATATDKVLEAIGRYRHPEGKRPDICMHCNAPFVYKGYKIKAISHSKWVIQF